MNRLTSFRNFGEYSDYFCCGENVEDALNKLGRLEDLEEELGCPLDVVFKALKEGILVNDKKWWLPSLQLVYMKIDNEYVFICESYIYKLKDYQKTWWV